MTRRGPGRPPRWHGELLQAVKTAYLCDTRKLDAVAYDFNTTAPVICGLARRYGWARRSQR